MLDHALRLLKKCPLDFGQEGVADRTKGKLIAQSLVPRQIVGGGHKALDVGCRYGVQSKWMEAIGYDVTSIDIEKSYGKCEVVDVNEGLPYPDDSFDVLWCSEVLEHLRDPARTIGEFCRVTKKHGKVILTTPNSHFWLFRGFSLLGLPPSKLQRDDHLHFFHLADIRRLCPGAEIYGFFPYFLFKFAISVPWMVSLLSPTFVVHLSPENFAQSDNECS